MIAKAKKRTEVKDSKILYELYLNSRISVNDLVKKFGISHHTMAKRVKWLQERYGLRYTVDINVELLGLSEPRVITVKFERRPSIVLLKKIFEGDPSVQNAYYGSGDFDLLLHIICRNLDEYSRWEYKFRLEFCNFKPQVKVVTLNRVLEGFLPIRSKLIEQSKMLNEGHKRILAELLNNGRMRLKDLAKKTKLSQAKVGYAMAKMKKDGIIRSFTSVIQNPEKRIFMFYGFTHIPNERHHPVLLLEFLDKIIEKEDYNEISTDYAVVSHASGHFDAVFFCNFKDGIKLTERGPEFLKRVWESEKPVIDQLIMTDVITGVWPFNANNYVKWRVERDDEREGKINVNYKYLKE